MTLSTQLNARQYLMLGEDPPGVRLELVHGEINVSPSPSYPHGYTLLRLSAILLQHIDDHELGEIVSDIDTILDEFNVPRPDIIFVAKRQIHLLSSKAHGIHFPPELCVEILSPGSATMDQTDKVDLYAKSGVHHYWLVDPINRSFHGYRLSRKRYVKTVSGFNSDSVVAAPFPKLSIALARIWPPTR